MSLYFHLNYIDYFILPSSRIITSGSDGDIRIWQGIDDDDPNSECIGEFVICIVHYPDRILASTDLNTVQVKMT